MCVFQFKTTPKRIGYSFGLVPTAAAATAATSAAAVTTATATAATTSWLARTGFIHGERPAVVLGAVDAADRGLGLFIAAHFDKAKTLAAAGVAIHDHFGALNRSEFTKQLVEIRVRNVITQIANVQLLSHDASPAIGK
jgi:hypothetical protein